MPDIRMKVQDKAVTKSLADLSGKMTDLLPVMKVIGEYLVRSTEDRFNRQGPAPDGTPWAPLKASTRARKKHSKTLTESSSLRGDIHYRLLGPAVLAIGTTGRVPYGAIHQLGGRTAPRVILPSRKKALRTPYGIFKKVHHPGSVIPARPFLGVSANDSTEIVGIINTYLGMR